jgi:hypothetical protein
MKSVLVRLSNLDMTYNFASQVNKVWLRKDETIHPLRGSGPNYLVGEVTHA